MKLKKHLVFTISLTLGDRFMNVITNFVAAFST